MMMRFIVTSKRLNVLPSPTKNLKARLSGCPLMCLKRFVMLLFIGRSKYRISVIAVFPMGTGMFNLII